MRHVDSKLYVEHFTEVKKKKDPLPCIDFCPIDWDKDMTENELNIECQNFMKQFNIVYGECFLTRVNGIMPKSSEVMYG